MALIFMVVVFKSFLPSKLRILDPFIVGFFGTAN
jgi:hypothetical protein